MLGKFLYRIFFSLIILTANLVFAMDGFGQMQQKKLSELSAQLFKIVSKNKSNPSQIDDLLGEDANIPEGFRKELLSMRNRKGKTLLQKSFSTGNTDGHQLIKSPCSAVFFRLWELGANLKDIPSHKLVKCLFDLIPKAYGSGNIDLVNALFTHSTELHVAIIDYNMNSSLIRIAASSHNKELVELTLMQPGITQNSVATALPNCSPEIQRIFQTWLEKKNTANKTDRLHELVRTSANSSLERALLHILDDKERSHAADSLLNTALMSWGIAATDKTDIARGKTIAILIKAGGNLSVFSKDEILARNNYCNHNLLHAAAHMGGELGYVLAKALLTHSDRIAKTLLIARSQHKDTPLVLAQNCKSQTVIDAIKEFSKPILDTSEVSLSVTFLDQ